MTLKRTSTLKINKKWKTTNYFRKKPNEQNKIFTFSIFLFKLNGPFLIIIILFLLLLFSCKVIFPYMWVVKREKDRMEWRKCHFDVTYSHPPHNRRKHKKRRCKELNEIRCTNGEKSRFQSILSLFVDRRSEKRNTHTYSLSLSLSLSLSSHQTHARIKTMLVSVKTISDIHDLWRKKKKLKYSFERIPSFVAS